MSCSLAPSARARRRRLVFASAAWLSLAVPALSSDPANQPDDPPAATVEEEITVTATRSPRPVKDTPGAVSVIQDEEIDWQLMTNAADLVRFEPGIYVDNEATRLGLSGFNIRGIGGNRVLTRIDGVATGERFEFGPLAAPQYVLDLDALKSVEIVRSAGSSLYGSDALGGVVSFLTKDPADYLLAAPGGRFRFEARAGYADRNGEWFENGAVALGGERWQGSLFVSRSDGEEMGNQGTRFTEDATRTAPNPQDTSSTNALGKLVFAPGGASSFKLTGEVYRSDVATEVYTSRTATVADFDAVDEKRRDRVSLEQILQRDGGLFDSFEWRLHAQRNDTEQRTEEELISGTRHGLLTFEQSGLGGEIQLQKVLPSLGDGHLLTYGVSYTQDDFDQIRDRSDRQGPLVFPTKYFPESVVEEVGVYVQDEFAFAGGRLKLVPGVRYDRYSLDADENDPVYLGGNAGIEPPADLTASTVSPRIGVVYQWTPSLSTFGQYARGFRAPAFNAVNSGFTNVASGYTTLPNPDLEPETSHTAELGFRGSWRRGSFSVVGFRNRFDDFIETVTVGFNPATRLLEFQPRNVGEAEISGVELSGEARLGDAWTARASAASIDGDNETTGLPLNSIAPASAALGLRYARPGGRWGGELAASFTAGKDEDEVDRTAVDQFTPDGSEIVDLTLFFDLTEAISLNVGGFNLLDETYWAWPDAIGRAQGSPTLDRYTRPGRNFIASLRVRR